MYYWTKYFKKSVSILSRGYRVENWGHSSNETVQLERIMDNPFGERPKPRFYVWPMCKKFVCDVVHFTGKEKPWMKGPPEDFLISPNKTEPQYHWFLVLYQLNEKLDIGLNFSNWKLKGLTPPLGLFAVNNDIERKARALKIERNL